MIGANDIAAKLPAIGFAEYRAAVPANIIKAAIFPIFVEHNKNLPIANSKDFKCAWLFEGIESHKILPLGAPNGGVLSL